MKTASGWFARRLANHGPTWFLCWSTAFCIMAYATVTMNIVEPKTTTTVMLNAATAVIAGGFWFAETLRWQARRHAQKLVDQMPADVSMHVNEDGSISGVVTLGSGDMVGVMVPDEIAAELDPNRPETTAILAAYVFEQLVPKEALQKTRIPSVDDTRKWVEGQRHDDDD